MPDMANAVKAFGVFQENHYRKVEQIKKKPRTTQSHSNDDPEVKALAEAVVRMHGSPVRFVGSVPVHEQFQGATVWEGMVSRFELPGHPATEYCYAWSVPAAGDSKERFYAILHTPQVDSAEKAVRASIIADQRNNNA
jgi:hypothetical protein